MCFTEYCSSCYYCFIRQNTPDSTPQWLYKSSVCYIRDGLCAAAAAFPPPQVLWANKTLTLYIFRYTHTVKDTRQNTCTSLQNNTNLVKSTNPLDSLRSASTRVVMAVLSYRSGKGPCSHRAQSITGYHISPKPSHVLPIDIRESEFLHQQQTEYPQIPETAMNAAAPIAAAPQCPAHHSTITNTFKTNKQKTQQL